MEKNIRKVVGQHKEQDPLKKLIEINAALKKLGCRFGSESPSTFYKKIVGRR